MKITAIISEYNPFHNGHKYLIDKARENGTTHCIAVMGGNFLQRGDCSIIDKYSRAEMAVCGGIDLVIELPQIYATASAERFAFGAVDTIIKCGCVDELAFGSECGDTELLTKAAEILDNHSEIQTLYKNFLKMGYSHPRAMQSAIEETVKNHDNISELLSKPNNILAIEYIKALRKSESKIDLFSVKRAGVFHNELETCGKLASASAIREMVINKNNSYYKYIPDKSYEILQNAIKDGRCPAESKNNERGILSVLRSMSADDFLQIPDVTEGLENRLIKAIKQNNSVPDIIMYVKSKRYTYARISRIITCAYLGINKEIAALSPQYIRVLALNGKGAEILKVMKKTAELPLVMSPAKDIKKLDEKGKAIFETDIRAADLHGLFTPQVQPCSLDFYSGVKFVGNIL